MPQELFHHAYMYVGIVPHALVPAVLASEMFIFFFHPSCITPQRPPRLYSSPPSLSFPLYLAKLDFVTCSSPSACFSANSPTPTLRPPLTRSLGTQNSLILSLQQQKELLTNSLSEYKFALRQSEMEINEQVVCNSSVTTACKNL